MKHNPTTSKKAPIHHDAITHINIKSVIRYDVSYLNNHGIFFTLRDKSSEFQKQQEKVLSLEKENRVLKRIVR